VLAALAQSRRTFGFAALFSMVINLLMLVPSLYMLQVYDRVLTSRSEETLLFLSLIVIGLLVTMALLEMVRAKVLVRIGGRLDALLGEKVFNAVFALNLMRPAANRAQSLRDLDTVRQFLTGNGPFAFFDAPWAPLFIAIVFLMHPLLGWIAIGGALVLVGLALATEFGTRRVTTDSTSRGLAATTFVEASLRNGEVLAAMGMLAAVRRRWRQIQAAALKGQAMAGDINGTLTACSKVLRLGIQSAILGAGAWLALEQQITPGMMIAASIIVGRALAPVEQAIGSWRQFTAARSAQRRLDELLSHFSERPETMSLPAPTGVLAVERLVAAPPGSPVPVIKGVSFTLAKGEALAVVGPSAAGKSSLARLLIGIWAPSSGSVRLDGADVAQWNREELGPHLGYLPQDVELFDGTVQDNIARFGQPDPAKVVEAARLAGVHDLILRLPNGYDTMLGAGGVALSGGQRQRIGLARALYGDPALIVLDEPNSNLDGEGEVALVEALGRLKQAGRTVVLISHRPNIMGHVDKILVLRDGQVELFGPRQEVLAKLTRPLPRPAMAAAVPGP